MPERQIIQPVILVPMIAPMIMAMAWRSFIMAEFTKPTTMTLVAEEDWITAVTPAPSKMPLSGVEESRYRISSSLLPATFFSPSPISDIPYRNIATPPRSNTKSKSSIFLTLHLRVSLTCPMHVRAVLPIFHFSM